MRKMLAALQARSLQPLSSREIGLIWTVLAGSTVIFIQARFGPSKFGINLSPFDILVPAVVGWCLVRRRIVLPRQSIWVISAGLLLLLAAHSALSFGVHDRISIPHLAQGMAKFSAFVILTTLLVVLFSDRKFRYPPFPFMAAVFTAATIYLIVVKILLVRVGGGPFVPSTNFLSGLVGMLFLLVVGAYHEGGNTKRVLVGVAAIAATGITILFFNKGFALVAIGFFIVILFGWRGTQLERFAESWRLVGLMLITLAIGSAAVATMQKFEITPVDTDTIARSLSVRGTLWSHAISVGSVGFPLGIGVGQFATTSDSVPAMVTEGHDVAHNTALTWFAEFGLLGVLFVIGAAALAWRAAMCWPGGLRLMFLFFLAVPLVLHDGHGIRMVMLILALGIANFINRSDGNPAKN